MLIEKKFMLIKSSDEYLKINTKRQKCRQDTKKGETYGKYELVQILQHISRFSGL